jgi:hypothetical protein
MLNEIETIAMGMLLAGEHPTLVVLRDQLAVAKVADREFSGVGFFVHFQVPASSPRADEVRLVIGDVYAKLTGLEHDAGFLLFVSDGALDMLECFIVDDRWPTEPEIVHVYYVRREGNGNSALIETNIRDLETAFSRALPNKSLSGRGLDSQ